MNAKQIAIMLVFVASVLCPIIIVCLLLGAAINGWNDSLIRALLKELE